MLVTLREKHPIIFAVLAVALFAVVGQLSAEPWLFLIEKTGFLADDYTMADAVFTVYYETVCTIVMLLVLWGTKRLGLLRHRGIDFFRGLGVGAFVLVYAVITAIFVCMVGMSEFKLSFNPTLTIVASVISYLFVGLAEELMARAVVAETLLEHFGTERAGILKACLLSGFLFGLLHIGNIFTVSASFGIPNAISAFALGCVLAAIYYRCGNIWVTIVLHAVYDIGVSSIIVFLNMGTISDAAEAAASSGDSPLFTIVTVAVKFALAYFLLRKSKTAQVQQAWGDVIGK